MKVLIIDNEEQVRISLKRLLEQTAAQIDSIHEATSVASGIQAIADLNPDLVFLDVEMHDGTGFDLLKNISAPRFSLVFITAHDKYAVDAFRFSAIDFLLKPITSADVIDAVNRAEQHQKQIDIEQQIKILHQSLSTLKNSDRKLVLKDSECIHFVNINEIIRCEAEGAYTRFIIAGQKKSILISKILKEYDELLSPLNFIRVHNSHLINVSQILRFDRADGGSLLMSNGDKVPVSQRKRINY